VKNFLVFFEKFFLSLIFFLLLLESALQLLAFVNSFKVIQRNHQFAREEHGQLRILCIGDSFTFGVGAGHQHSYPAQLQRLIEEKYPSLKVEVINRGEPGMNSSVAAERISGYLRQFDPHIVLCCIGRNDNWNFEKTDFSALRGNLNMDLMGYRLDSFSIKFRTYKLMRYLTQKWFYRDKRRGRILEPSRSGGGQTESQTQEKRIEIIIKKAQDCIGEKDISRAVAYLNSIRDEIIHSGNAARISNVGWLYSACDERTQAVALFDKSLSIDNRLMSAYYGKGDLCFLRGEYDRAVQHLEKAAQMCPRDHPANSLLYRRLAIAYFHTGDKKAAIHYFKKAFTCDQNIQSTFSFLHQCFPAKKEKTKMLHMLQEFIDANPKSAEAKKFQFFVDFVGQKGGEFQEQRFHKLIDTILTNNLEKIFSQGKASGANVYFVNYPSAGYPPDGTAENFVNASWPDHLIDVQSIFRRSVSAQEHSEYFIPDYHCTAKGYNLMARTVFNFLEEKNPLFSKTP
jgi:tetratricopeptide (TPR) repeat protein